MPKTRDVQTKPPVSWLTRQFLKLPLWMYRLGFVARLERSFLVLTTTGRRTGRPHAVALDYLEDGGRLYIFAGYGPGSDWYRNLLARPQVAVQIGKRFLDGLARPVEDPAERRRLIAALCEQARSGAHGPPRPVRWIAKRLGVLDYDAELDRAVASAEQTPAVEIVPNGG